MDALPQSATGVTEAADERPAAATLTAFPDSGYYVLAQKDGRLIADFGGPGTSPNPGHQHVGIFSYELSLAGRRLVVDSGTPSYGAGKERQHARGTAAHNTVRVDGEDQYGVWKAFRVGRRAKVTAVRHEAGGDYAWISAAHDGYKSVGVVHRRAIAVLAGSGWVVVDLFLGSGRHRIESFVHLNPETGIEHSEQETWLIQSGYSLIDLTGGRWEMRDDWYSPRLGQRIRSRTLVRSEEVTFAAEAEAIIWAYGLLASPVKAKCTGRPDRHLVEIESRGYRWAIAIQTDGLLRITRNPA